LIFTRWDGNYLMRRILRGLFKAHVKKKEQKPAQIFQRKILVKNNFIVFPLKYKEHTS